MKRDPNSAAQLQLAEFRVLTGREARIRKKLQVFGTDSASLSSDMKRIRRIRRIGTMRFDPAVVLGGSESETTAQLLCPERAAGESQTLERERING
ncbi:hypothetical protein CRG98_007172 [Punica granatum]|uniref:Uncharacterized protein n=1 Tax=Punica granatum TaxID=22663 RepID=A0A2I0KX63_PUNGR|nr:hypothetical protein CRG98_007172 [Punica granatum]